MVRVASGLLLAQRSLRKPSRTRSSIERKRFHYLLLCFPLDGAVFVFFYPSLNLPRGEFEAATAAAAAVAAAAAGKRQPNSVRWESGYASAAKADPATKFSRNSVSNEDNSRLRRRTRNRAIHRSEIVKGSGISFKFDLLSIFISSILIWPTASPFWKLRFLQR